MGKRPLQLHYWTVFSAVIAVRSTIVLKVEERGKITKKHNHIDYSSSTISFSRHAHQMITILQLIHGRRSSKHMLARTLRWPGDERAVT